MLRKALFLAGLASLLLTAACGGGSGTSSSGSSGSSGGGSGSGSGGSGSGSATPTVTIDASPKVVAPGQIVNITWASANAKSITITPTLSNEDPTGTSLSGTAPVQPGTTTTYTAVATGSDGTQTSTASVTVTVIPLTITASSTAVNSGDTVTFTVTGPANGSAFSIDHNVGQLTTKSGTQPNTVVGSATANPAATTTYTVSAQCTGCGTATATVTVNVTNPLTVTLSASPATIAPGVTSTLTWTTQNATSLSLDNGLGNQSSVNAGTVSVRPSVTTTYTATATDSNGSTLSATATVVVSTGDMANIKHIIFMVQENRSFDNYFGKLGAYRVKRGVVAQSDVNDLDDPSAQFLLTNPSPANQKFGPFHARTVCTENLSPSWDESHFDVHIDSAHSFENLTGATYAMDRFLQTTASGTAPGPELYDPTKTRPLGYYDETDLPFYYELATQFSTSDAFHSPVLSNTNPNRMYLFSATSSGYTLPGPTGHSPFPAPTIFRALNDAGISWRYYFQDGMFLPEFQDWNDPKIQGATYPISDWYSILSDPNADNLLPQVVFIERAGTEQNPLDEHPDNNIQVGAADVEKIMRALFNSGAWHDSVFILTYDEGGGLFDHVPPFQEAKPDNIEPMDYPANENPYFFGEFNLSGFRVPVLVVSPWVKPHYVSHLQMDYTAILKMIETRFGLNPLTARDAAQPDMWREFFDFSKPNLLTVPSLPHQPSPATNDGGVCDQSLESSPNPPQ